MLNLSTKAAPYKFPPSPTLYRFRFRLRRLSRAFRHTTITHVLLIILLVTLCPYTFYKLYKKSPNSQPIEHDANSMQIGLSQTDITPTQPVWLAGFASRNHSPRYPQLLHQKIPLTARALAIHTANMNLVLVTLDIIALPRILSSQIYKSAFEKFGLTTATLRICVTHTHSGPVISDSLQPLSPTDQTNAGLIQAYERVIYNGVIRAIGQAKSERQFTTMQFTKASASLSVNRRQIPESLFDSKFPDRGQTDDTIPIILFKSPEGHIKAGIFGYAEHPTILTDGYRYSGDYPSLTIAHLERRYTQSTWYFLTGCAGDQNIYPRGGVKWLLRHSNQLATAVEEVITSGKVEQTISKGDISALYKSVHLPFAKTYTRRELRKRATQGAVQRLAVNTLVKDLTENGVTKTSYKYPIAVWKIDSLKLAFLGGEPTIGYTNLLKDEGIDWTVGYSQEVMRYVGTKKVIESGGREGGERSAWYYGLPAAWSTSVEDLIVETVRQLLKKI